MPPDDDQPPLPFEPPPRRAAGPSADEPAGELSFDRLTAFLFEEFARRAAALHDRSASSEQSGSSS